MAELRLLPVELIDISPHNPRRVFDDEALHSLADSIARLGVLQPILVKSIPEQGRYEIVAGERRWRASRLAQRIEIPALVIDVGDVELHEVQLVENLQREQLNPIEEAVAFAALQAFGYSDAALAQRLKLHRSAFQRAEPGWAMLRHQAGRLRAERGTSTPFS